MHVHYIYINEIWKDRFSGVYLLYRRTSYKVCFSRLLGFLNLISQKIASEKRAGPWFQVDLEPQRKQTKNTFKCFIICGEEWCLSFVYLTGYTEKTWLVKGRKLLGIAWAVQTLPGAWQQGKTCQNHENMMVLGKNEIFLKLMGVLLWRPVHQTSVLFLH